MGMKLLESLRDSGVNHGSPVLSRGEVRYSTDRRSVAATWGDAVNEGLDAARLRALRQEHRDLDAAIAALVASGSVDQLQMARLKKRKLRLRDEIAALEDRMIPDITA
jgi:hypothetical protein